jgi:hypothetical protein
MASDFVAFERSLIAPNSNIRLAANVKTLKFAVTVSESRTELEPGAIFANYPSCGFTQLRKVELYLCHWNPRSRNNEFPSILIDTLNNLFANTKGKMYNVGTGWLPRLVWFWAEPDGGPLKFSWKNIEDRKKENDVWFGKLT